MDQYTARLIALRNELRNNALIFCNLIEANDEAVEPDNVAKVRNLIEVAIAAIDETPIE
jgi:hypothetical protein